MSQVDGAPDPPHQPAGVPAVAAEVDEGEKPTGAAPGAAAMRIRAVRGFAWAALSFGGNKLLVFLSTLVLTRLLDPADFGVVAAGLTVIAYLEVTLDLGMSSAVVYRQEQGHPRAVSVAFTVNVTSCLLLALANLLAAPLIADFFRVPNSADVFRVLSVYILLRGLGAISDALLKRDLRFKDKAAADAGRALTRGGLGVALALAGAGVWALVWSFLAAEAVGTAVGLARTRYRPRLAFDLGEARSLLAYGIPVAALQLLSELGLNSDYFVVGHAIGSVALGLYTVAFRLPELLLSNVYWIFSSVAFPVFSSARTQGTELFRESMLRALRLITLFGFPVGVGLALVSRDTVTVLFGDVWAGAGTPMALLSLAIGLGSIGYASGDIFKAAGRPGTLLWVNGIGTVILVVAFVLSSSAGIGAVAAVHLCYNFGYGLVRLHLANRLVGTTVADVLRAMRPALLVCAGITALALPARLLLEPGAVALLVTVCAGLAGAGLGLALAGRQTLTELRQLAGALARRPAG